MNRPFNSTIQYYDDHAEDYARSTVDVDMSSLYKPFLAMVPNCGRILDAGCGAGRDTKSFIDLGYDVTAIDASARMAALASRLAGVPVKVVRFREMSFNQEFDGVWACASLLHVPSSELADVVGRVEKSLRPGGVFYASFKHGSGERTEGGRLFNDLTEGQVTQLIANHPSLSLAKIWTTLDARPERNDQKWVNVLFQNAR